MIKDEYGRVSDEILYDIAKAVNVHARDFGSHEWATRLSNQRGAFSRKEANRIASVSQKSNLALLAWTTLNEIEMQFPQTEGVLPRNERVLQTLRAVENQTSQYYGALNATMLRSANQLYQTAYTEIENQMLLATEAVMTGMATKMSVTKTVLERIQKLGVTGFVDKRGRKWSAEAYADLVMRSSMGNIQRQIMVDRCHDYGEDIVYAPKKYPSRPLCFEWQGKLLSLSDQQYTTTDLYDRPIEVFPYSSAVGAPAGLWGCNCGHGHAVFIPNLSEVVEPVNKMTPEQNEQAYALTQQERELERNIRNNKTRVKMLEEAGITGDELEEAKNKLKQATNEYKGFLDKYGYDPTAGRTYVNGYKPSPSAPKPPKTPTTPITPTTPVAPTTPVTPTTPVVPASVAGTDWSSEKLKAVMGDDYEAFEKLVNSADNKKLYDLLSEKGTYDLDPTEGSRHLLGNVRFAYQTEEGLSKFEILAHENGHLFDYLMGRVDGLNYTEVDLVNSKCFSFFGYPLNARPSSSDEFLTALRKDGVTLKELLDDGTLSKVFRETSEIYNMTSGIQDTLDGFFGTQSDGIFGWGHGNKYYNRKYNREIFASGKHTQLQDVYKKLGYDASNLDKVKQLCRIYDNASETWANISSAVTTGGDVLKYIKKYLPETYKAYMKIVGDYNAKT